MSMRRRAHGKPTRLRVSVSDDEDEDELENGASPSLAESSDNGGSDDDFEEMLPAHTKAAKQRQPRQGSQDDSDDLDTPLLNRRRPSGRAAKKTALVDRDSEDELDESDDAPLARRRNSRRPAPDTAPIAQDSQDDLTDSRRPDIDQESEDDLADFDVPLAKKRKKPTKKPTSETKKKKPPPKKPKPVLRKEKKEKELFTLPDPDTKDGGGGVKVKFEMPGQRRLAPPQNEPLRLFYESMYHESVAKGTKSVLAEDWMLSYGLLEREVAEQAAARQKQTKLEKSQNYATQVKG